MFCVARVRANENKLLTQNFFDQLIKTDDYSQLTRMISEQGYSDIGFENEDSVFIAKIENAYNLALSPLSGQNPLEFLMVINDFHNIKAIFKCLRRNTQTNDLFRFPSIVDPALLKDAIVTEKYVNLPKHFSDVLIGAHKIFIQSYKDIFLETYLDKKCLEMFCELAFHFKNSYINKFANLYVTLLNLKNAIRCLRLGKDEKSIKDSLMSNDNVDINYLCKAVLSGKEELSYFINRLGFSELSQFVGADFYIVEKTCDNILMDYIKKAKCVFSGPFPLLAYCIAVETEIKNLKIVLSCKRHGVDEKNIKERLRKVYV